MISAGLLLLLALLMGYIYSIAFEFRLPVTSAVSGVIGVLSLVGAVIFAVLAVSS